MADKKPRFSLRFLGTFSLTVDGRPVERWRAGKARSLFQYLVINRDRVVLRDKLQEVLWPDREWSPTSSSLKVAMHAVRRTLHAGPRDRDQDIRIVHHDFGYALYANRLWVDVDEFEAKVDAGRAADKRGDTRTALARYREAMELYRGDFLTGEDADWIIEHREWCRALALHALGRLSAAALERDDVREVLVWCRRLIDIEPYREETYRLLIAAHGRVGELGAARRWYDRCVRRLRDELGVEPCTETRRAYQLAVRGQQAGYGQQAVRGRPAGRGRPAVLGAPSARDGGYAVRRSA